LGTNKCFGLGQGAAKFFRISEGAGTARVNTEKKRPLGRFLAPKKHRRKRARAGGVNAAGPFFLAVAGSRGFFFRFTTLADPYAKMGKPLPGFVLARAGGKIPEAGKKQEGAPLCVAFFFAPKKSGGPVSRRGGKKNGQGGAGGHGGAGKWAVNALLSKFC